MRSIIFRATAIALVSYAARANADGMLQFDPYLSVARQYDDNVFRFSSRNAAKQAGFNQMSDSVTQTNAGLKANLTLSRQFISGAIEVGKSQYDQFEFLDNVSKSGQLNWSWKLGDSLYGELSAQRTQSIVGFTENKTTLKNLRTIDQQRASLNYDVSSRWTLYGEVDKAQIENEEKAFFNIDRDDDTQEIGVRYHTPANTQLGLSYRHTESSYPKRDGASAFFFGKESTQTLLSLSAVWMPTPETRMNALLSKIELEREGLPQRDFSGFSQRWVMQHMLTGKTTLNASAYQEVSPIDDVLSTYIKVKGLSTELGWNATAKVTVKGGMGYEHRDYLGDSGLPIFQLEERSDVVKNAHLSVLYQATNHLQLELQYTGEKRDSNVDIQGYDFNSFRLQGSYHF